jgi:hypothetical protein
VVEEMLKKKFHQKIDSRDIGSDFFSFFFFFLKVLFLVRQTVDADFFHGESGAIGHESFSLAPSPLITLASSFSSAVTKHRRVHSDAQSPSMDRRSRGGSPDDEVDPFKKKKKQTPQLRMGSFRNKKMLSPDDGTLSSPSEDVTPGTKKKLINKLLSRARSNTRDKLHPSSVPSEHSTSDWLDETDSSSEGGTSLSSRKLERQDSMIIHDVVEENKDKLRSGKTPALPRLAVGKMAASTPDLTVPKEVCLLF